MRASGRPRHSLGRSRFRPVSLATAVLTAAALGIVVHTATARGTVRMAMRMAAAARTLDRRAPSAPPSLRSGRFITGTPAVGALFSPSGHSLGSHFCTASVVDSSTGDVLITAAHCVSGLPPGQVVFVPGYSDGRTPYGIWQVTHIFVAPAWSASQNPDDDVAFLVVHRSAGAKPIQAITGGERLGTGWGPGQWVHVIAYPSDQDRPLACQARTSPLGATQMQFNCAGYSDGSSGGPFLADFSASTGEGTVIGVIGGYQLGGDTPAVSYSARFGSEVQSLYRTAVSAG